MKSSSCCLPAHFPFYDIYLLKSYLPLLNAALWLSRWCKFVWFWWYKMELLISTARYYSQRRLWLENRRKQLLPVIRRLSFCQGPQREWGTWQMPGLSLERNVLAAWLLHPSRLWGTLLGHMMLRCSQGQKMLGPATAVTVLLPMCIPGAHRARDLFRAVQKKKRYYLKNVSWKHPKGHFALNSSSSPHFHSQSPLVWV